MFPHLMTAVADPAPFDRAVVEEMWAARTWWVFLAMVWLLAGVFTVGAVGSVYRYVRTEYARNAPGREGRLCGNLIAATVVAVFLVDVGPRVTRAAFADVWPDAVPIGAVALLAAAVVVAGLCNAERAYVEFVSSRAQWTSTR